MPVGDGLRRSIRPRRAPKRLADQSYSPPKKRVRRNNVARNVNKAQKEKHIGALVRFMLFKSGKQEMIKTSELYKLLPNMTAKQKQQNVKTARARVKSLFGYDTVDIEPKKKFILKCTFECLEETRNITFQKELCLRFIICSVVLLNAAEITEKDLYRHLSKIGLKKKDETGVDTLGTFMSKLIVSNFLAKEKRTENERDVIYYKLGARITVQGDISRQGLYQFLFYCTRDEKPDDTDDFLVQCRKDDSPQVADDVEEKEYTDDEESC